MRRLSAQDIKQIELGIPLEFDRICTCNGLAYLLAYGTALGAVRHGGFIPWDDDIDVIMPRDDYERLYTLFSSGAINSHLKLTGHRDSSSIYHFLKLTDPKTLVHETFVSEEFSSGLWIDIFPLERVSTKTPAKGVWRRCARLMFLKALRVGNPKTGTSGIALAAKRMLRPFVGRLDPYGISAKINALASGLNSSSPLSPEETEWVCIDDLSYEKSRYEHNLLFPASRAVFEGHALPVAHRVEDYLAHCYGNWRQLPPENERHSHFPQAFALED